MCWQLCAMFSFPPNWQLKKLDSIFYQLQYCSYIISHSQGCQFLSSNLEKDSFSGKMMTCEPCIHISHLSLLPFPEQAVFSSMSTGKEQGFVVSGQSLTEHGLKSQPFPLLWLYWQVPNQHCTLSVLQQPPRITAEPAPWLTLTWNRNIHSGYPAKTQGTLTQQCEALAQLAPFWDPRAGICTFTAEEFKLPSDAEMKLQDGRT